MTLHWYPKAVIHNPKVDGSIPSAASERKSTSNLWLRCPPTVSTATKTHLEWSVLNDRQAGDISKGIPDTDHIRPAGVDGG